MAESKSGRRRAPRKPAIVDIEAAEVGVRADFGLNAIELIVTNQEGRGFRCWIGSDRAPTLCLRFCGATMRLREPLAT